MDYRRFGDTIIARMDKGEEIVEQVRCIALKENIKLASVEVLGALSEFHPHPGRVRGSQIQRGSRIESV